MQLDHRIDTLAWQIHGSGRRPLALTLPVVGRVVPGHHVPKLGGGIGKQVVSGCGPRKGDASLDALAVAPLSAGGHKLGCLVHRTGVDFPQSSARLPAERSLLLHDYTVLSIHSHTSAHLSGDRTLLSRCQRRALADTDGSSRLGQSGGAGRQLVCKVQCRSREILPRYGRLADPDVSSRGRFRGLPIPDSYPISRPLTSRADRVSPVADRDSSPLLFQRQRQLGCSSGLGYARGRVFRSCSGTSAQILGVISGDSGFAEGSAMGLFGNRPPLSGLLPTAHLSSTLMGLPYRLPRGNLEEQRVDRVHRSRTLDHP
jgi:hypothetical protein